MSRGTPLVGGKTMETGFLFLSLRRPVTLNWAPREAIKHKSLYSPTLRAGENKRGTQPHLEPSTVALES